MVAAAVQGGPQGIITATAKDFPAAALEPRHADLRPESVASIVSGMYGVVNEGGTGAAARIEEVRRKAEQRRIEERDAARSALEAEVRRILADADREAGDRRKRRTSYLTEKETHAQALLFRAAELYAKILSEGPTAGPAP